MSHLNYVTRLGDDALIHAQRLMQWATRAPALEEEVALANVALDLLGQARAFYTYAGELEGAGRGEDDFAFLREEQEFGSALLLELENGDFAHTIARMLCFATYQFLLYEALSASADTTLAAIAAKAVKESAYHVQYAARWTTRLGDGTAESRRRMGEGLTEIWPYTHELFRDDPVIEAAAADRTGPSAAGLYQSWLDSLDEVFTEATLVRPEDGWMPRGGRQGTHTEAFGFLVAEMQCLHRAHPGARW